MLAKHLKVGFVPVRKPGKLPYTHISESYELEYGVNELQIHEDAIEEGDKVLIHDDLLATGGSALAAKRLVERLGGEVVSYSFIIELSFLNARAKLSNAAIHSLIVYE
jgi:adenine phosphoribosyltransferase